MSWSFALDTLGYKAQGVISPTLWYSQLEPKQMTWAFFQASEKKNNKKKPDKSKKQLSLQDLP